MPLKRLTMTRTKSRATSVGRHRRNSGAHTLLSYRDAVEGLGLATDEMPRKEQSR
jgi:hypothetical protein